MKRNVDIVRDILVAASQQDEYESRAPLAAEHAVLLIDLGYLAGQYIQEADRHLSYIEVMGLTQKGRALLQAVRNEAAGGRRSEEWATPSIELRSKRSGPRRRRW